MAERMKFLKKESSGGYDYQPTNKYAAKKSTKLPQIAAALHAWIPEVPQSLLDMLNDYRCRLCSRFVPTLRQGLVHFNSDEHQQKLLDRCERSASLFHLPEAQLQELETGVLLYSHGDNRVAVVDPISKARTEEIRVQENLSELDMTYCSTCCVSFTGSINALKHYGGKKHKKARFSRMTAPARSTIASSLPGGIGDEEGDVHRCQVCHVSTASWDTLQMHLDGKPHQKKLQKVIEENNMRGQPPDVVAKLGVIDLDCEEAVGDGSYQPYGLPPAFFSGGPPHARLEGWWQQQQQRHGGGSSGDAVPVGDVVSNRYGHDRYIAGPEILLKDYLDFLYK